jgi:hypothetical protein
MMNSHLCLLLAALSFPLIGTASQETTPPSLDTLLQNWQAADHARLQKFTGYTSRRQYDVKNGRFGMHATMAVDVTVDADGSKHFKIRESTGPGPVRKLVFQRMLDTESGASAPQQQASTRISPDNYNFKFDSVDTSGPAKRYILEAEPKSSNPLLFRGKVWLDADSLAVVRIEGEPAKNPSFWVQKTHFVHEYINVAGNWFAATNRSETDVRAFGKTVVQINYSDYEVNRPAGSAAESSGSR